VRGIELQYGSLYVARGESTEITSYDDDGYVLGERASIRRRDWLLVDDVTVTFAYLGDITAPGITRRWRHLDEVNYRQVQVSRQLATRGGASFDVTRVSGVTTVRPAAYVKIPESRVVDQVRVEVYRRLQVNGAAGFAVSGDKQVAKRLRATVGYADIDPRYGGLNGDRYLRGKRFFLTLAVPVTSALTASWFSTHAVGANPMLANHVRNDVVVAYNLVPALKKTGWF